MPEWEAQILINLPVYSGLKIIQSTSYPDKLSKINSAWQLPRNQNIF